MSELEFRDGYYEWNIFINDDCFYSFDGDIGESIDEDATYEDLECIIDDCIYAMQLDLKENNRELLEEKYIPELKKQMLEELSYYFGIER